MPATLESARDPRNPNRLVLFPVPDPVEKSAPVAHWIEHPAPDREVAGSNPAGRAKRGRPASGNKLITLRLAPDVIEKFKATGKGWQSRMNDVLRKAIL
jgi:uncharacterized protein (DUF4415 family)